MLFFFLHYIVKTFQTDSIILSENKEKINSFLQYDYVGAPWTNQNIGNGGLSLRNKNKMIEIIQHKPTIYNQNEDIFFSTNNTILVSKPSNMKMQKTFQLKLFFQKIHLEFIIVGNI